MVNSLVPLEQALNRAPAKMAERRAQGVAGNKNFTDGVRDAFPTLSIKGKVFRFRHQGAETAAVDANGYALPYLDVILVDASPYIAKTFYAKGYTEGDLDPPDCWSINSIRPDPSVENKQNPTCLDCPMNQFGSRITEAGKQAKACQDQRRMAITLPHHLTHPEAVPVLTRVPQSSLKNLKVYADLLDRHGLEVNAVITRMSFEPTEAFPKLRFEYQGVLDDTQYDKVLELAEGETARLMLSAPIVEPSSENLDPSQTVRPASNYARPAQAQRPAPAAPQAGNVTPLRPTPQPAPAPAPQPTPAPPPAAAKVEPTPGIMALPDGRFYNPVTQQFCGPDGHPIPEPGAQVDAPMTAVQAELFTKPAGGAPTWTPPAGLPPLGSQPSVPPAAAVDPGAAAASPKRTRRPSTKPLNPANGGEPGPAPAAEHAPAAPQVQAADPALNALLASFLPKS
jgi:hypothetical protein